MKGKAWTDQSKSTYKVPLIVIICHVWIQNTVSRLDAITWESVLVKEKKKLQYNPDKTSEKDTNSAYIL